jgi:hypothetical protein
MEVFGIPPSGELEDMPPSGELAAMPPRGDCEMGGRRAGAAGIIMLGPADGFDDDIDMPGGGAAERPSAATRSLATVFRAGFTGGTAALA